MRLVTQTDIVTPRNAAVLAIAILANVAVSAQSPPALQSLAPADLDAFITRVVADQKAIGVTVGVMRDGKIIFSKGYGVANLDRKTPVSTTTLFAVGSVTKQFTCAVALQLEQEGKLSFDDRVSRYRADFGHAGEITLRDLGNHVSGYRDYYPLDFVDRPMAKAIREDDLLKQFTSKPLDFPPGTRYSYSNTGYLLLGSIASLASRQPFDQLLQQRIFAPLGMTLTRYEPARGSPGLADGYTQYGLGPPEISVPEGRGWIGAAGGIWSTPEDLLKWDLALMDGKVVNATSWKTMTSPRELKDGRSSAYGCGLQLRDRAPQLVLVHSGGVSGFGAINAMIPATRSGVVAITNADYSGGVLSAIQEAVLAKMMPAAIAPTIAGPPARDAALEMLRQIRSGVVDRSQLADEYNAFLTPARLSAMSKSLQDAGEISQVETGSIGERGGLEVSTLRMLAGTTPISTLMYRAPDGKIEEFLFSRR
jgi:CubicO group peptidase (beta-lactamase class C family)